MKEIMMRILSKRTFSAIIFISIGYACVLGYVASTTDREVQFFPPRIGPDVKASAVVHMGGLEAELSEVKTILDGELVALNARLAEARTNMAAGSSVGGQGSYEWRQNVRSYEKDLRDIRVKVVSRVQKLENSLASVRKSCADLGLGVD